MLDVEERRQETNRRERRGGRVLMRDVDGRLERESCGELQHSWKAVGADFLQRSKVAWS